MPLNLPDDLAPECYPLAWLVGRWRGFGMVGYPGIPESPFVQEFTVDHDGGPYLRAVSTLWLATTRSGTEIHQELTGAQGVERLDRGQQWATETQYWRPVGSAEAGTTGTAPDDGATGVTGGAPRPPTTQLEVLASDPAGLSMLYLGEVTGPRITLATDAVLRTATAADVAGARLMYGLVQSDLLWAQDLAAFGQEMRSYASGRLTRVEES